MRSSKNVVVEIEDLIEKRPSLESMFPAKPEEPLPQDCCGCSCNPCVFDIYRDELQNWATKCKQLLNGNTDTNNNSDSITPSQYSSLELMAIIPMTENTKVYRFATPNMRKLPLLIGQHLILKCAHPETKRTITRQYTPINNENGYFDVMIKVYDYGKMSACIKQWKIGDLIDWRGPFGNFNVKPNQYSQLLLLAAGTGIAPIAQIIEEILGNDEDMTRVRLLFACRNADEILLAEHFAEWERFWNFSFCYYFSKQSQPLPSALKHKETNLQKIDEAKITSEIEKLKDKNYLVVTCGTKAFDKDIVNYLLKAGVPSDRVFKF